MTRSQSLRSIFILLAVSLFIAACGGGGGGSSDLTPDNFSFSAEETAERDEVLESGTITVGGIDKAVSISIADGEYRINGGTYTSSTGTVSQGQTVEVRLTASPEYDTEVTSTVTIGGVSGSYSATTRLKDIEPSTLSFDTIDEQEDGATVTSLFYVVAGVDDDTEISINLETSDAGATYSINSEEESDFVTTAGQVSVLDEVRVRVTAGSGFSATTSAFVTVGSVEASFSAVTIARDVEPGGFSIDSKLDQPTGSPVTSNPYTVVGINAPAAISIVSPSSGVSYSINSEDADDFVSIPGTVVEDDVVRVRIDAGDAFDTDLSAIVAIGGVESTFSISTEEQDIAPDVFSIVAVLDAGAGAVITSDDFPVAGINDATAITISAGATYSLDSIVDGDFTSTAGTVTNEQRIRVRLNASAIPLAVTEVTLTLGTGDDSQSATFTVRTALTFESPDDQLPTAGKVVSATTVAIADFGRTQSVVVTNGEYSVDGGTTYQDFGDIENGQTLQVRANVSTTLEDSVIAIVTITDPVDSTEIEGTYTVTTVADEAAPTAAIHFPPAVSLTEGTSITVRGVASDALSDITRVQLNGEDVTSSDDFATWTISVVLTAGDNTLVLSVEDAAGQANETVDQVVVTQGAINVAFPSNDVPLGGDVREMEIDIENRRLLVSLNDDSFDSDSKVIAVNLANGIRTVFSDNSPPYDVLTIPTIAAIEFIEDQNTIFASDAGFDGEIWKTDLNSQVRTLLSSNALSDVNIGPDIYMFEYDSAGGRLIVSDAENNKVVAVDEVSGLREVLYIGSAEFGVGAIYFDAMNNILYVGPESDDIFYLDLSDEVLEPEPLSISPVNSGAAYLVLDGLAERLIMSRCGANGIYEASIETGERSLISNNSFPSVFNSFDCPLGLGLDEDARVVYVFDSAMSIFAVDLISGERVIFSKSL